MKQIKARVDCLVSLPKFGPVLTSTSMVMSLTARQKRPTAMVNKKFQPWLWRNPRYINSIALHSLQRDAQRSFLIFDDLMSRPLWMGFISFGPRQHTIRSCCFLAKILGHGLCSADLTHTAGLSKQIASSPAQQKLSNSVWKMWNGGFAGLPLNAMKQVKAHMFTIKLQLCKRKAFFFPAQWGITPLQKTCVKLELVPGFFKRSSWRVKTLQKAAAF